MRKTIAVVSTAVVIVVCGTQFASGAPGKKPVVTTSPATNISTSSATVNGTVNPRRAATSYVFRYGPTAAYGSVTPSQNLSVGNSAVAVSAAITGLAAETTYHYQLSATNTEGTSTTADAVFTTSSLPPPPPPPPPPGNWPSEPPARICGSALLDGGPTSPPDGYTTVPAGDNSGFGGFQTPGARYWFAPGVHTLGSGAYAQIIPGSNSVFVGAPGAVVDGQHDNRYAFTQHATGVTIRYLTIRNFGVPRGTRDEGVVNHDSGVGWLMEYLSIEGNSGAAVMLGSDNTLRYSCLKDNGQYGYNTYNPTQGALHGIVLDHTEITGNNTDDWESVIDGCGCTGGGKFWDAHTVRVTNNYVHGNRSIGLWADQNNYDFVFEGNWIEGNHGYGIFYETSYNAIVRNNVFRGNAVVQGQQRAASGDNFPDGAIYVSESGYDPRVGSPAGATSFDIVTNLFQDNWGGVVLWENADRFCNSPANTSTGYCTLVNPTVVTVDTCDAATFGNDGSVKTEPYYSDCRWKTQHVRVNGNQFHHDPANLGNCSLTYCGRQAVLSNWGTYPSWSPYQGPVIQQAIAFGQDNLWANNQYFGSWRFTPFETGPSLTFAQWQAAPYGQDVGSVLN